MVKFIVWLWCSLFGAEEVTPKGVSSPPLVRCKSITMQPVPHTYTGKIRRKSEVVELLRYEWERDRRKREFGEWMENNRRLFGEGYCKGF